MPLKTLVSWSAGPMGTPVIPSVGGGGGEGGGGGGSSSTNIDGATIVGAAPQILYSAINSKHTSAKWTTFNGDGTKVYIPENGTGNDEIWTYDLSTPYDITTYSNGSGYTNSNIIISSDGMIFNHDGTKMILFEVSNNPSIKQYDLNTPYDVSSVASNTPSATISNDPSYINWDRGVFANNGSKFYAMQTATNGIIKEFTCSTPGDLATASAVGSSNELQMDTVQGNGESRGLAMNAAGTRLYVGFDASGDANEQIFQYELATQFDLSTASYNGNLLSGLRSDNFAEIRHITLINDTDLYIQGLTNPSGGQGAWQYSLPAQYSSSNATDNGFFVRNLATLNTLAGSPDRDESNPSAIHGASDGSIYITGVEERKDIGFIQKHDATGALVWAKQLNSTANFAKLQNVKTDSTGAVYAGGYDWGYADNLGISMYLGLLAKFDKANGNIDWVRILKPATIVGGSAQDYGDVVDQTIDNNDNIWTIHSTAYGTASAPAGYQKYNINVVKLNTSGAVLGSWVIRSNPEFTGNNANHQFAAAITHDASGNIYIMATTSQTGGQHAQPHTLVIKFNSTMQIQWQKIFGAGTGSYHGTRGKNIALDSSNDVYIAGYDTPYSGSTAQPNVPFLVKLSGATGIVQWGRFATSTNNSGDQIDGYGLNIDDRDVIHITGRNPETNREGVVLQKFDIHGNIQDAWYISRTGNTRRFNYSRFGLDEDKNGNLLMVLTDLPRTGNDSYKPAIIKLPKIINAGTEGDLKIDDLTHTSSVWSVNSYTHSTYSVVAFTSGLQTVDQATGSLGVQTLASTNSQWFEFNGDGTSVYIHAPASGGLAPSGSGLQKWDLTTAYDLTTATYANLVYYGSGNDYEGKFAGDGSKFYYSSGFMWQHNLSTNFVPGNDIKTGGQADGQGPDAESWCFKSDGTKLYILAKSNTPNGVIEYDLSSAWDIATNSLAGGGLAGNTFNYGNQMTGASNIEMNSTGTKFYIYTRYSTISGAPIAIVEYDMTTPWDITTGTYNSKYLNVGSAGFTSAERISFRLENDNKIFVKGPNSNHSGNDVIYQYTIPSSGVGGNAWQSVTYSSGSDQVLPLITPTVTADVDAVTGVDSTPPTTAGFIQQTTGWNTKNGTNLSIFGNAVTQASDGSYYFTGEVNSKSGWLAKFNEAGAFQWVREYGTYYLRSETAITDSSNNVYIAGSDYGYGENLQEGGATYDPQVLYVAKFNSSGTRQWSKLLRYNTLTNNNYATMTDEMKIDSHGNIWMTGYTHKNTSHVTSHTVTLYKIDSAGALSGVWRLPSSIVSDNSPTSLVIDENDNMYISWTQDDPGYSAQGPHGVVAKMSIPGAVGSPTFVWVKEYGMNAGGTHYDVPYGILKSSDGNVIVYGYTDNGGTFSSSDYETTFMKLNDTNGDFIWKKRYDSSFGDILNAGIDDNDKIYFTSSSHNAGYTHYYFWVTQINATDGQVENIWEVDFTGTASNGQVWQFESQNGNQGIITNKDGNIVLGLSPNGNASGSYEQVIWKFPSTMITGTHGKLVVSAHSVWSSFATLTQTQKITAGVPSLNAEFGSSIAFSEDGNYLLIGAKGDRSGGTWTGRVWGFYKNGNTWTAGANFVPPNITANDRFGIALDITGNDTAIIGGDAETVGGVADAGAAHIYYRSGNNWSRATGLTQSDPTFNVGYGRSVGISGDYAVVGAPQFDSSKGKVYVWYKSSNTWALQTTINGGATNDYFGGKVAIDGDTMVVTAPYADIGGIADAGGIYVYTRSGTTWSLQQTINHSSIDSTALQCGANGVFIKNNTLIFSSIGYDGNGANSNTGGVFVYTRSGSTWSHEATIVPSTATNSYISLFAGSENAVVIGHHGLNSNTGQAYLYARSGTTWSLQKTFAGGGIGSGDYFGYPGLAIDPAGQVAVAAGFDDISGQNDAGSVFVFKTDDDSYNAVDQTYASYSTVTSIGGQYQTADYVSGTHNDTVTTPTLTESLTAIAPAAPSQGWISTISDELQGYGYTDVSIRSLAVDGSDNIIAAGDSNANYQIVIKIASDGTVDSAAKFGASGKALKNRAVAVDSGDNIFTAGEGPSLWNSSDGHVMRLTSALGKSYDDFFGEGSNDEHFDIATAGTNAFVVGEANSFALNWSSDPKGYLIKYDASAGQAKQLIGISTFRSYPRGVSSDGTNAYVIGKDHNQPMWIAKVNSALNSVTWSANWGTSSAQTRLMDIDTNSSGESAALMFDGDSLHVVKIDSNGFANMAAGGNANSANYWKRKWSKAQTGHGDENTGYDWCGGVAVKLLSNGSVAVLVQGFMPYTGNAYKKSFYIVIWDSTGNVTVQKEFKVPASGYYLGDTQKALVQLSDGKLVTAFTYYTGSAWKNGIFKFDPTDTSNAINGTYGDWTISDITDGTSANDTIQYSHYSEVSGSVNLDSSMSMYFKSGYQGVSNGYSVSSATVVEGTQNTL